MFLGLGHVENPFASYYLIWCTKWCKMHVNYVWLSQSNFSQFLYIIYRTIRTFVLSYETSMCLYLPARKKKISIPQNWWWKRASTWYNFPKQLWTKRFETKWRISNRYMKRFGEDCFDLHVSKRLLFQKLFSLRDELVGREYEAKNVIS